MMLITSLQKKKKKKFYFGWAGYNVFSPQLLYDFAAAWAREGMAPQKFGWVGQDALKRELFSQWPQ